MNMLMIILSLIGGALLSVQAAVNGRLGAQVGILRSAFLTFSIGALVTGLFIVFFAPQQSMTLLDVPKWQLLGAFCGVPYIVIMVLAVQRIGTATATVAVIFGQLAMSLLIDNFGWLGNSAIAFFATTPGSGAVFGVSTVLYIRLWRIRSSLHLLNSREKAKMVVDRTGIS